MAAMSLQGFLITWLIVGVLHTPADRVGFGRALIEMPGLAILLIGGVLADRTDGRRLLIACTLQSQFRRSQSRRWCTAACCRSGS